MKFLRRDPTPARRDPAAGVGAESVSVSELPALMEFLTVCDWGDGEVRETSTLLFFFDEGVFKVCLNDRALERSMWASGYSLVSALTALESSLSSETGEWRKSPRKTRR